MSEVTALSGKPASDAIPDIRSFMKAFVAALIARGQRAVRPKALPDRKGFQEVVDLLDQEADRIEVSGGDPEVLRSVMSVANHLRSSNTGAYDGFETELRALQLTFTRCPNLFYKEISFTVPEPYARSVVASLPGSVRALVEAAADRFLEAQSRG